MALAVTSSIAVSSSSFHQSSDPKRNLSIPFFISKYCFNQILTVTNLIYLWISCVFCWCVPAPQIGSIRVLGRPYGVDVNLSQRRSLVKSVNVNGERQRRDSLVPVAATTIASGKSLCIVNKCVPFPC